MPDRSLSAWCFFEYHLCTRSTLTHLPSGQFAANAAWLTLAAITHNLTRAAATLAAPALNSARAATIRTRIINIAARLSSHTRAITLHLPQQWPWQQAWDDLSIAVHAT